MGKKVLTIILALLGIGLVFAALLSYVGFFKSELAGILIETEPSSTVYFNGIQVGETPYDATREAGEIVIRIVPKSTQVADDYETKINLVPGVKTIIKRTFKQNEEETSGATVSFEKISGEESMITVVTIPDNAQISIDGRISGFAPLRSKITEGDHELLVSQVGYLDKKLPVRGYKGYKLTAVVKLAKDSSQATSPTSVISEPEPTLGKIEILPTDIGFLRVRKEANVASEVLGQVKPGEVYDIQEINGDNGWYKIKVKLDTNSGENQEFEGWVSGEFVKKLKD